MPGSKGLLSVLGGSWVVISGGISRVTVVITPIRGLISLLIKLPMNLQVTVSIRIQLDA